MVNRKEHLGKILFLDIETASVKISYDALDPELQKLWDKKAALINRHNPERVDSTNFFSEKAGIYSEFGKVVTIAFGWVENSQNIGKVMLKSLSGDDEKVLLNSFFQIINRFESRHKQITICGHNIKEFDIPFLCRRAVIHNIPIPDVLNCQGKKPWEVEFIDTMELWKFGDYKHFTSLDLLANVLGIPSPKSDINGSQVSEVYWKSGDLERIARYCLQDVLTTIKVYLRLVGISLELEPVILD